MKKSYLFSLIIIIILILFLDKALPLFLSEDIGSIDKIIIDKGEKKLSVFREEKIIKEYSISLGGNPIGHKEYEGDLKTPEGIYKIDWKHPNSSYHLALHLSYPKPSDIKTAKKKGLSPGGDIMIHGMPNGLGFLYPVLKRFNWTDGCVAVSNVAMEEIVSNIKIGISVYINP